MATKALGKGSLLLSADGTELTAQLEKAKKNITGFSTKFGNIDFFGTGFSAKLAAGLRTAFDTAKGMFSKIVTSGDQAQTTQQMADMFGLTTDRLQELGLAASISGVQSDRLYNIFRKVSEVQHELQLGGGEFAKTLDMIGLQIQEIESLDPASAFIKIGQAINKLPAGMQTGVAAKLLGGRMALDAGKLWQTNLNEQANLARGVATTREELKALNDAADKSVEAAARMDMAWNKFYATISKNIIVPTLDFINNEALKDWDKQVHDMQKDWNPFYDAKAGDKFFSAEQTRLRQMRDNAMAKSAQQERDAALKAQKAMAKEAADREAETKRLETARLENAKMATGLIGVDPLEQGRQQLNALRAERDKGTMGWQRGVANVFGQLQAAAGIGGPAAMPSAMTAGSAEDIRARLQDKADARFGDVGPATIINMLEKQLQAENANAERLIRAITDTKDPTVRKFVQSLGVI